jgi:hypothetical protein
MAGIEGDIRRQERDHVNSPKRELDPIDLNRYTLGKNSSRSACAVILPGRKKLPECKKKASTVIIW